ncbi:hypothetical protein [Microbacterium sp. 1P06AB]|uniref:hypothetical protein n=1 Tax=Microbacterium sp. 1P06AB TaxID=3132289 RepID=UPI0039A66F70
MLMLSYWASRGERWAEEAHDALVARYPGLDLSRDENGRVISHEESALTALQRLESDAVVAVRDNWHSTLDELAYKQA